MVADVEIEAAEDVLRLPRAWGSWQSRAAD